MDLSKYLDLYLSESREHVSGLRRELPAEGIVPSGAVNELFRRAHSLKGMAASMGFEATSRLSHGLESLLNQWRQGHAATSEQIQAALRAVDVLDASLDVVQRDSADEAISPQADEALTLLLEARGDVQDAGQGTAPVANLAPESAKPRVGVQPAVPNADGPGLRARIKVSIDPACALPAARLMVMAERIRAAEPASVMEPDLERVKREGLRLAVFHLPLGPKLKDLARSLRELTDVSEVELEQDAPPTARAAAVGTLMQTMRVSAEDLDGLRAHATDLLYGLNQYEASLSAGERRAHRFWLESERAHLNRLFDQVLSMRLVSFEVLAERLGRTARDLAGRLGKPARMTVTGAEERVDRGLLETLLDPLTHLVRNAMDHGVESQEERRRAGKPGEASLALDIRRESEALLISLEDDGRGIDAEVIRQAAVERGLYTPHEAALLDRAKLLDLLTVPAFSTRKEVSDVSGRGVGLDVVRSAVESVGGHLEMTSEEGKGSRFTLVIPSATTLTRVLVFGWEEDVRYGIPASQIRHIYPLSTFPLVWSGDRRYLQAGNDFLPVLAWRPAPVGRGGAALRLIGPGGDRVLLVSRVYQGERVVVMPWGPPLEMISEWMGGALLATGEIAYILDGRVLVMQEGD